MLQSWRGLSFVTYLIEPQMVMIIENSTLVTKEHDVPPTNVECRDLRALSASDIRRPRSPVSHGHFSGI